MGLFSTSVLIPESSRIGSRCEWWHWGGFCVRRGIFFIRSQTVRQGQEGLAKSANFKLGVYSRRRARVQHHTCDRYQQGCGSHKEVCPATWRWRTCEKVSTFFLFRFTLLFCMYCSVLAHTAALAGLEAWISWKTIFSKIDHFECTFLSFTLWHPKLEPFDNLTNCS